MIAALSFLLDFEKIEDDDSDDSDSENDPSTPQPQVVLNKEAMYKVGFILSTLLRVFWVQKLQLTGIISFLFVLFLREGIIAY